MLRLVAKHGIWCPIAAERDQQERVNQLHHTMIHDTKNNRRRFPLLIDSLWNLTAVNKDYHMAKPSWSPPSGRWSLSECDRRDQFLGRHPTICAYMNPKGL